MNYAGSSLEIKQLDDSGHIEGLLAGIGNVDAAGHVIEAKAFTRTLAERNGRPLPMLLHHDMQRPIGVWKEWQERREGLFVKGDLTLQTQDAKEAHALAKSGALTGLSIGFVTRKERYDGASGTNRLLDIDLVEGSLVSIPCNPLTHVSAVKAITGPADITDLLRASGMSGRKAKAAACAAWQSINDAPDDAEAEAEAKAILDASAKRIAGLSRPAHTTPRFFDWS